MRDILDRGSPLPLWAQILQDVVQRLKEGEFSDDFPPELDLAAEYGVSRNTIRETMRRLRDEGVVIAERGRRPRLATDSEIEQPLGALYSLFASVEAAGLKQQSVTRCIELRTDEMVAHYFGLPSTALLFYLERVRLAGGEPLAIDRVWMPENIGAPLLNVDFSHTALYDELYRRTGLRLTTGSERIRAVRPSKEERGLLAIGASAAALAIDRLACVQEQPIEWRHTIIRGDRFNLVAEFSARSGYQFDLTKLTVLTPEYSVEES